MKTFIKLTNKIQKEQENEYLTLYAPILLSVEDIVMVERDPETGECLIAVRGWVRGMVVKESFEEVEAMIKRSLGGTGYTVVV